MEEQNTENKEHNSEQNVDLKQHNRKWQIIKIGVLVFVYLSTFLSLVYFSNLKQKTAEQKFKYPAEEYIAKKEYEKAIEAYLIEIQNNPTNLDNYYKVATLYKKTGNLTKAEEFFLKAHYLSQYNSLIIKELTRVYMDQKKYDEAEETIENINDDSKETRKMKGVLYFELSKSNPDNNAKISYLIKAYAFLKPFNEEYFKETKKSMNISFLIKADELEKSNQPQEAISFLESSLDYIQTSSVYNKLAILYIKTDPNKAYKYLLKSLKINYSETNRIICHEILINLGNEFKKQGNDDRSQLMFIKAKQIDAKATELSKYIENKNIISVNIEAAYFERFIPQVVFDLKNLGKTDIKYLKAKITFEIKGVGVFEEGVVTLATKEKPFFKGQSMADIHVSASKPLDDYVNIKNCVVTIYLSAQEPDQWRLYRMSKISPP